MIVAHPMQRYIDYIRQYEQQRRGPQSAAGRVYPHLDRDAAPVRREPQTTQSSVATRLWPNLNPRLK